MQSEDGIKSKCQQQGCIIQPCIKIGKTVCPPKSGHFPEYLNSRDTLLKINTLEYSVNPNRGVAKGAKQ